jgi:hypothetical protein
MTSKFEFDGRTLDGNFRAPCGLCKHRRSDYETEESECSRCDFLAQEYDVRIVLEVAGVDA